LECWHCYGPHQGYPYMRGSAEQNRERGRRNHRKNEKANQTQGQAIEGEYPLQCRLLTCDEFVEAIDGFDLLVGGFIRSMIFVLIYHCSLNIIPPNLGKFSYVFALAEPQRLYR